MFKQYAGLSLGPSKFSLFCTDVYLLTFICSFIYENPQILESFHFGSFHVYLFHVCLHKFVYV